MAISPNELRLGNWVHVRTTGENEQVKQIHSEFGTFIDPIEITEEWLLRFGFQKKDVEFQDELLDTFMWSKDEIVDVEFSDKHGLLYWHENYSSIYHQEIKYIHQLQNLYFSLTGKELENVR